MSFLSLSLPLSPYFFSSFFFLSHPRFSFVSVLLIFNASLIILAPSSPMYLSILNHNKIYHLFSLSLVFFSRTHHTDPILSKVQHKSYHKVFSSSSSMTYLFIHMSSLNPTPFIVINSFFYKPFTFITPVPLPPSSFFIRNPPTTFPPSQHSR